MFEKYNQTAMATATYKSFYESNKNSKGFEKLADIGDAAFFHSDNTNFCLIVIQKDNILIRLKVNKITPKTSFQAMKKVGKDLVDRV